MLQEDPSSRYFSKVHPSHCSAFCRLSFRLLVRCNMLTITTSSTAMSNRGTYCLVRATRSGSPILALRPRWALSPERHMGGRKYGEPSGTWRRNRYSELRFQQATSTHLRYWSMNGCVERYRLAAPRLPSASNTCPLLHRACASASHQCHPPWNVSS